MTAKRKIWVCEVEYQRKGDRNTETFQYESHEKARDKMRLLIAESKKEGTLAEYFACIGLNELNEWEITESEDFIEVNGFGGDFFTRISVEQRDVM